MKMLEDLEEVARALQECTAASGVEGQKSASEAMRLSTGFMVTHHATIRDVAKRLLEIQAENSMLRGGLEAAERDAARWRYVYTEHMVIRDRGGIYHGDVDYPTAEEIDQAMQETGR